MSTSLISHIRLPMVKTLRITHVCFLSLFLLITFLFWQQGELFNHGYRTSQLSHLESVIARLESKSEYQMDNLRYLRRMFIETLNEPQFTPISQLASRASNKETLSPLHIQSLPIPDSVQPFKNKPKEEREKLTQREYQALRDIQDLFPLAGGSNRLSSNIYYMSRSGAFIASLSPDVNKLLIESANPLAMQGSFVLGSPLLNPRRDPFWTRQNIADTGKTLINGSLPVDFDDRWIGLFGIAVTTETLRLFLSSALPEDTQSAYLLFDEQMNPLTRPVGSQNGYRLSEKQRQAILEKLVDESRGTLRFGYAYATFGHVTGTGAILVSVQTIRQGLHEDFGRFSVLLVVMWLTVILILFGSHRMICRLISNMGHLQQEMHRHALHDDLTGVLNRRGFFETTGRISPQYVDYSLIQLDLDHFKKVNDRFGHQVGDRVLIHATRCIQQAIRTQDIVGRIGGEEFCVYLPNTDLHAAIAVAQRVRKMLVNTPLRLEDESELLVTASLGVASHEEAPDGDLEHIQSQADIRLYRAKQQGRNRVCWGGEAESQA
ncbi:diguanylate cyclase [Enterobacter sp. TMH.L2]